MNGSGKRMAGMKEEKLKAVPAPPQKPDLLGGILSYLVPGLGQLYQGRLLKAAIFFVGLYGLFFYGLYLGKYQNVFLTNRDSSDANRASVVRKIVARPHFGGQFFIGIAAWPAIIQHVNFKPEEAQDPRFGKFMREPTDEEMNAFQRDDNKIWDLAWVYTVIAGVLNILVIYDAVAGPAFIMALVKEPEVAAALQAGGTAPTADKTMVVTGTIVEAVVVPAALETGADNAGKEAAK
jgi:hypothetical protein